jgi:ABC-type branched-subunit amino acid transport system ATPase component/predicted MFS family arabinose efflux permease
VSRRVRRSRNGEPPWEAPVTVEEAAAAATARPGRFGRIAAATGGASIVPLAVLFFLNFVDEFDRLAFATLTPELRDAFNLSDAGIASIGIIGGVFTLMAALPIGLLGDRFSRVRLAMVSAVLWGTMSVATGLAPTVLALFFVRLFAGIGRVANEVIHPSLLGDYYEPRVHPRVFQIHRFANPLSGISGIIAGVIADAMGYRWAFYLLAIPTVLILVFASRLREPVRGESIDKDLAEQVAADGAIPFGEARRQLFATRTLKRLWLGGVFLGIGWIPIGQFLSLFFENVYDFGPTGRGLVTTLENVGVAIGLVVGGYLATRVTRTGNVHHLASITGLSFVAFAVGLVLMSISPWAPVSVVFAVIASAGVGGFQPAYFSLVGLVSPPKVRSQAFAWAVLFVGAGGLLAIPLFELGDTQGYRVAVGVLAGLVALAGMIGTSAYRFVKRDIEQATKTLETAVKLKEELQKHGARQSLLVCRGIEVAYDQVQVLFGVDMDVKEGEIIALLGTNGAGKSTLLKAISGLVDPIGGAIFFDGRDITHADAPQTAKMGIIQVPGGKAIFPTLSVAEHFRTASWLYSKTPEEVAEATEEVLQMFPRLRERWDQLGGNMSGGEQQMLALGMAFIAKPKLLMIDELSLGLAPTVVEQLLEIVRKIHEQGATIILVEQSVNVALTIAERAYFMEKGEVRFSGPTQELLERGDILRSVFLQGAASRDGKGRKRAATSVARDVASTQEMDGRPPLLEVTGLTIRFGGITAVDEVDLVLHHDEILGLIGPNGAGKTTIFDLISGHLTPDQGRFYLDGMDFTDWPPDRRAAHGLGRSFQDARIFPSLTVAENVALGLERHVEVRDHMAAALNLPAILASEDDVAWTVDDLIELMGLGAFRDKFVSELSTGTRRVVDLAMSIAHDPKVLLLDEPSSGIAQRETEALAPLLRRIRDETGCGMLVIEHDMPLITGISDEIVALELGRVIVRDTPQAVITNARVIESYLGGDMAVIQRSGAGSKRGKRT